MLFRRTSRAAVESAVAKSKINAVVCRQRSGRFPTFVAQPGLPSKVAVQEASAMKRIQPPARTTRAEVPQQRTRSVAQAVLAPHTAIGEMFTDARAATPTQEDPRGPFARCDTFLATLSRHLAAVEDVVFPAARRRISDGPRLVARHVRLSRGLELAMRALEGSFYGDSYYPAEVRDLLWERMDQLLALHDDAERSMVEILTSRLSPPERRTLIVKYAEAEESAPTRPHPYSPHSTWLSPAQHRLWAIADRAMDSMDNRIIPSVRKRPRADPDSLLSQYLSGAPRFREDPA
jgi:hypothetical protein